MTVLPPYQGVTIATLRLFLETAAERGVPDSTPVLIEDTEDPELFRIATRIELNVRTHRVLIRGERETVTQ